MRETRVLGGHIFSGDGSDGWGIVVSDGPGGTEDEGVAVHLGDFTDIGDEILIEGRGCRRY